MDINQSSVVGTGVEFVRHGDVLLAIIVGADFCEPGIRFFTPNDFSQQLAYMHHPAGKKIAPHVHNPVPREVRHTLEVLFIRKGRLRVDFYSGQEEYLRSTVLFAGDTILLVSGGHGFEMLEATEIIEVKQGPYTGQEDKRRFEGVPCARIRVE